MRMKKQKIFKFAVFLVLYIFLLSVVENKFILPAADKNPAETPDVAASETIPPAETAGLVQDDTPRPPEITYAPVPTATPEPVQTETPAPTETITEPPAPTPAPVRTAPPDSDIVSPYFKDSQYGSPYVDGVLSNVSQSWYYMSNDDHQPPTAEYVFDIRPFNAYYLGDIYSKVIYLTFDEGYENGYTSQILDVLKEKGVQAAFFVTKPYIESNPDLVKRMVDEGHIVGNHTVHHLNSSTLSDADFDSELTDTADYFKEVTGTDMSKFFRPPNGEYSARTLQLADDLGYKTIFWSFAYQDWVTDDQPGKQAAYDMITSRSHNGCIMLLHAVSQSDTEALPDVIDYLLNNGYTFKTLDELDSY